MERLAQQSLAGRDPLRWPSWSPIIKQARCWPPWAPAAGSSGGFVDMTTALRSRIDAEATDLCAPQGSYRTLIDDRPTAFGSYAPQNFDGSYRGELRVAEALRSLNIPTVA